MKIYWGPLLGLAIGLTSGVFMAWLIWHLVLALSNGLSNITGAIQ
jgi:uncharacterized membrane protein